MHARKRASVDASMNPDTPTPRGFRRQVVFRLDLEHWPLLEKAIAAHGSIQAAVIAGLEALGTPAADPPQTKAKRPVPPVEKPRRERGKVIEERGETPAAEANGAEEIPARDAARLLGLKTGTVSGYIRTGRLPGRYDEAPTWHGWLTTRAAVEAYRSRQG
jgi:hypothetical protein